MRLNHKTLCYFKFLDIVKYWVRLLLSYLRVKAIPGLTVNNMMTSQLKLVEGTEVVVSHVKIPAKTTLPKHWHPGEEFLYLLKGSGTLWQQDKSDTQLKEGDVFKVPLKEIHTFTSDEDGASILVFRVHEKGQPVRVNLE